MRKIAQLRLLASSFGIEVGRASESEVVVTVVIIASMQLCQAVKSGVRDSKWSP
jgi:hypothetical protein